MFAGRLGIVRIIPGASHFTSTASIATCYETRLMERAEMKRKDGGLLCDWRLKQIRQARQFGIQDNESRFENNMTDANQQGTPWTERSEESGQMTGDKLWEGEEGGGGTTGRELVRRVERRAKRRKFGQQQRAHFLFILLLSEWPSLVVASSEPESLPLFRRGTGIKTKRKVG
jgi:hypothetical protein